MKQLFTTFIIIIFGSLSSAQNLKTDNLFILGNTGWELTSDVETDHYGNYYITGSFSGKITLSDIQINSNGKRDLFLAKFNEDNRLLWVKNFGGPDDDNAYSLLLAGDKIYFAGSYRKNISFNDGSISLKGQDLTDLFLAQLDTSGILQWANTIISNSPVQKAFLQMDSLNNVWIAGSSVDNKEVYAHSFNTTGTLLQSLLYKGDKEISLNDFKIDKRGNLYFAGLFKGTLQLSEKTITSNGKADGYLAKIDNKGNILWVKSQGGIYDDVIKSLAVDTEGNVYAAGEFKYEIVLDKPYIASQNNDVFLLKYNTAGALLWSLHPGSGGKSYNTVTDIVIVDDKKFYLSGTFRGKLQDYPEVKSEGNSKNAFLARFDTDGNKDWIFGTRSSNENKLSIKSSYRTNELFISGFFSESFTLDNYELKNHNYKDIFFGKMVDCDFGPKVSLNYDSLICTGSYIKAKHGFTGYLWNNGATTDSIMPISNGLYIVTAIDRYGCQSKDSLQLTVKSLPEFDLGSYLELTLADTLKLNPMLEGDYNYIWSTGQNTSSITLPMVMFPRPTLISLTVTDQYQCTFVDSVLVVQYNLTQNKEESEGQHDYSLYPNPSTGKIYITHNEISPIRKIEIFDIRGNMVKSLKDVLNYPIMLDLTGFDKGVYLITIIEDKKSSVSKVVLQ